MSPLLLITGVRLSNGSKMGKTPLKSVEKGACTGCVCISTKVCVPVVATG